MGHLMAINCGRSTQFTFYLAGSQPRLLTQQEILHSCQGFEARLVKPSLGLRNDEVDSFIISFPQARAGVQ